MGGVSHPSQHYASKLLEPKRVQKARRAVEQHYNWQRERYGRAFEEMGLGVYTGDGGFYHWLELPEGMTSAELNERLFKHGAAILCASDLDSSDSPSGRCSLNLLSQILHSSGKCMMDTKLNLVILQARRS